MGLSSWVLALALLSGVFLVSAAQDAEQDGAADAPPEMLEEIAPESPLEEVPAEELRPPEEVPAGEAPAPPQAPESPPLPPPTPPAALTATRVPEPVPTPTIVATGCFRSYLTAAPSTIQPQTGMSARVQLDASGFAPGSLAMLAVHGPSTSTFSSATARVESNCEVAFTLQVPPDARGGSYRPIVSGTGYDGRPLEVSTEIIVVLGRPSDRDLRASVLFVDTSRGRADPSVRTQVCNLAVGWQASYVTVQFVYFNARGEQVAGQTPSVTVNSVPSGANNCRSVTTALHAAFEWQRIEIDTVQVTWVQE